MEENMKEEMTNQIESESQDVGETVGKKPSKKKFIIIGGVAIVAVIAVVLFFVLGGVGKGKIKIEGKTYSYSSTEGIKGIADSSHGVVQYSNDNGMDVLSGKYPVVYMYNVPFYNNEYASTRFGVFGEFETHTGATHDTEIDKLDNNKKLFCVNTSYYSIITEKGVIDWKDIEEDYEEIIDTNSFECIDYIDGALAVGPDAIKFSSGDVEAVVSFFEKMHRDSSKGKAEMIYWLATGKATQMLIDGEIDYFVVEIVDCSMYDEQGNVLFIGFYTSLEDAEKMLENID